MSKKRTLTDRIHRFVLLLIVLAYIVGYFAASVQQEVYTAVPSSFANG